MARRCLSSRRPTLIGWKRADEGAGAAGIVAEWVGVLGSVRECVAKSASSSKSEWQRKRSSRMNDGGRVAE